MTKSDNLCQYPCSSFSPPPTSSSSKRRISNNNHKTYTVKKRISTSLRDDIPDDHRYQEITRNQEDIEEGAEEEESTDESVNNYPHQVNSSKLNPPRSSKSMVIGTFFGQRRGHVCFCIQYHRLNSKPSLLLEFSMPTAVLIKEMQCGLVQIALESCNNHRNTTDTNNNNNDGGDANTDTSSRRNSTSNVLPLLSIPVWTMCISGRRQHAKGGARRKEVRGGSIRFPAANKKQLKKHHSSGYFGTRESKYLLKKLGRINKHPNNPFLCCENEHNIVRRKRAQEVTGDATVFRVESRRFHGRVRVGKLLTPFFFRNSTAQFVIVCSTCAVQVGYVDVTLQDAPKPHIFGPWFLLKDRVHQQARI